MKRLSGTLGIGLALVWGLLILVTGTPQVQAQTNPNAPAAPHAIYLPLIAGKSTTKVKSGLHLGNRNSDWKTEFFQLITGTTSGIWPASVVVLSNQLYTLSRYNTPDNRNRFCQVNGARVRSPKLYAYLTQAVQKGKTKVIIRITPSPGNFKDYNTTKANPSPEDHITRSEAVPAGDDYCGQDQHNKSEVYRDVQDIVNEMKFIYDLNTNAEHQWPQDSFYFEPANEPNYEWYDRFKEIRKIDTLPTDIDNSRAWANMDDYFGALIKLSQTVTEPLQVLTPAMAQGIRAERLSPGSCGQMTVVGGENGQSGYDFMPQTYLSNKFAGYSWHNYWNIGHENLEIVKDSIEQACTYDSAKDHNKEPPYEPQSYHVEQYFSYEMQNYLLNTLKPSFITEADVKSPCPEQDPNSPLVDKTATLTTPALPSGVTTASRSLKTFIRQENFNHWGAPIYINAWLLVNEFTGGNGCQKDDKDAVNYEINWHEAYGEDGVPHSWFTTWWLGDE